MCLAQNNVIFAQCEQNVTCYEINLEMMAERICFNFETLLAAKGNFLRHLIGHDLFAIPLSYSAKYRPLQNDHNQCPKFKRKCTMKTKLFILIELQSGE